jgi:hypothetical protein
MENLQWSPVFYNGLETNIEVTKNGDVRRVKVEWSNPVKKLGQIDFTKLSKNKDYYFLTILVKGYEKQRVSVHQLVAAAFLDYKFKNRKIVVDHIDSDTLNNRLSNLRVITHRENTSKERSFKSGLPTGIYFCKSTNKYVARIYIQGKNYHLGRYITPEEASEAYQLAINTL